MVHPAALLLREQLRSRDQPRPRGTGCPTGDGLGRLYTATQFRFTVQVNDGLLDIGVLDRGPGNPPENATIK